MLCDIFQFNPLVIQSQTEKGIQGHLQSSKKKKKKNQHSTPSLIFSSIPSCFSFIVAL